MNSRMDLPPACWGEKSGLVCLDHVVEDVWAEGYSHHLTRLMVLSNLGALLDVRPREIADWFWVAYTDAYDWVVEPNVIAMGGLRGGRAHDHQILPIGRRLYQPDERFLPDMPL